MKRMVSDTDLITIRDTLINTNPGKKITSEHIRQAIKETLNVDIDVSTIRGRFIQMGQALGSSNPDPVNVKQEAPLDINQPLPSKRVAPSPKTYNVVEELKEYIPSDSLFDCYVERGIDKLLAIHYDLGKYPLTQGKQGTGKTFSHMHYAWKRQLPFFLYSAYADFNLRKYFGDKTITAGSIVFQEGLFIKAISNASVILIDEVNAIEEAGIKDFNAFLQNRQLYIKDADGGKGKIYKLHDHCHVGFAQNPKSSKYIGGKVRSSDFLGRCTYLTYPEFTKGQIETAIDKKYPTLNPTDRDKFITFYQQIIRAIDSANLPFDISIRQLNNIIDLWIHNVPLRDAVESGMLDIADASSQPKTKEALSKISEAIWSKEELKR